MTGRPHVVGIRGAAVRHVPERMPDVVERLGRLYRFAKDGELHGLLYASIYADGSIHTGWVGKADTHQMEAAAAKVFYRVMKASDENE